MGGELGLKGEMLGHRNTAAEEKLLIEVHCKRTVFHIL